MRYWKTCFHKRYFSEVFSLCEYLTFIPPRNYCAKTLKYHNFFIKFINNYENIFYLGKNNSFGKSLLSLFVATDRRYFVNFKIDKLNFNKK